MRLAIPHPFPYQGSKRGIARYILPYIPRGTDRLVEPFCGSAAVSIAAAAHGLAREFLLNDINQPLMALWHEILNNPKDLSDQYATLWTEQQSDRREFFLRVRDEFNKSHEPHHLLYLLARIVKGSIRYSSNGTFNQSPDNRRSGMHPSSMRRQILGVSTLLAKKTSLLSQDFRTIIKQARAKDLVYMDPPYQGTSFTRDHRYCNGVSYQEFVDTLAELNDKEISYIVSYDGQTGQKAHGEPLPKALSLTHLHIRAGRSSQATLLGNDHETIESLYISPVLKERMNDESNIFAMVNGKP